MTNNIIHTDDYMYTDSLEHYTSCGKQFADFVSRAAPLSNNPCPRILELPCGYGRVTRHLVQLFPPENIEVGDTIKPAVDFCVEQFGVYGHHVVTPFYKFNNIQSGIYDVAVMGSLITHLSEDNAEIVLQHFLSKLTLNGVAVISTHGIKAHELCKSGN